MIPYLKIYEFNCKEKEYRIKHLLQNFRYTAYYSHANGIYGKSRRSHKRLKNLSLSDIKGGCIVLIANRRSSELILNLKKNSFKFITLKLK